MICLKAVKVIAVAPKKQLFKEYAASHANSGDLINAIVKYTQFFIRLTEVLLKFPGLWRYKILLRRDMMLFFIRNITPTDKANNRELDM